ncbi:DHA2 family efflux MFS transporter permease subunit [Pokkaliibacter sp. CJK22405]|uniref:DHA2 family efflux MFS transporter permease subunit n=1 Tax=Pokkaliibacter sp. CJK22405 TaxID=3384615 RepID=UPI003984E0DE
MSNTVNAIGDKPLEGGQLWMAALLLATANFIAVLDMTIANVSVPHIAGSLSATTSQGTYVITSYAVAEAITVPLTGWFASRFGTVRVFCIAMVMFGICSALCGLADSLGMLIAARVLQGLAGGPLMPLSQTLLLRIFPKEKTGAAMGLWAMTTLTAPILGPIMGGWLCDTLSWPAIFLINVPIALPCGYLAWRMVKRYETKTLRLPIDIVGLVLLIVWVGALQIMLDEGKNLDWFASTEICILAVVAVIGFIAFLIWELTDAHPVVDLRVFRHRGFSVSVVAIALGFGAFFAANVLTPLWLQTFMGYTATWSGKTTAWMGVLAVMAAPFAAGLSTKLDPRKLAFFGILWLGIFTFIRAFSTTDMTYWHVALPLFIMGLGMPFFFMPLNTLALSSVEERETASAAGLLNFLRTLSGAFATSLVTTEWENTITTKHAELVGLADPGNAILNELQQSGMNYEAALNTVDNLISSQGVMLATNDVMLITSFTFIFAALSVWLAPKPQHLVSPAEGGH